MNTLSRLYGTLGAQLFGQVITIAVQISLVPLLLFSWGTDRYGAWLLLAAIPTYLTFADFGFTFVAKNEMVMKVAKGDTAGVLRTYQSVFWLLNLVSLVLVAVLAVGMPFVPLKSWLALGDVPEWKGKAVLVLLCLNVVAYQYMLLTCAGMRAEGRPAAEVMWAACSRLGEGATTALAAFVSRDLVVAAAAILLHRLVYNAAAALWLRSVTSRIRLGWTHSSLTEIRGLLSPSVSYMFVSISQALVIQGPIIILGTLGHPAEVVVFSASRTLARLGTSAANVVNFSVTPEYSRLFGHGALARFRSVMLAHFSVLGASTFAYVGAMLLLGNAVLTLWTSHRIGAQNPMFALIVIAVAAEMIWSTLFTPLASINRHVGVSNTFIVVSVAGMVACALAARHGPAGVAGGLVAINGLMILVTALQVQPLLRRA